MNKIYLKFTKLKYKIRLSKLDNFRKKEYYALVKLESVY